MKHLILLVVATIVALLATLYFRLGAYKDVEVSEGDSGPWHVVSKPHLGAYHKIVPVIEEVEAWAKKNNEPCQLSFGLYIDDVDKVEEDRLRSRGGCVVSKAWDSTLPQDFQYQLLERRRYISAHFDGAPSIGPMKVYPKIEEYISEKNLELDGPVLEMYEILPDQKVITRYYFPVKPISR